MVGKKLVGFECEEEKVEDDKVQAKLWTVVEALKAKKKVDEYHDITKWLSQILELRKKELLEETTYTEDFRVLEENVKRLRILQSLISGVDDLREQLKHSKMALDELVEDVLDEIADDLYKKYLEFVDKVEYMNLEQFVSREVDKFVKKIVNEIKNDIKVEDERIKEIMKKLANLSFGII